MNSLYLLLGGLALLGLGYFVYGAWLEKVWGVDPSRPTPAHQFRDGVDYMPSKAPVVLGHHFSSIAGAGPINGPIQAAVFGWLPCFIWVVVGGIFFGGVHDFGSLFASLRNKGRSIGEVIAGSIGLRAKRLFVIFSFLTLVLVVGAFASIVAGTFNGFMSDASGALVHNHVNGSTATISLLFIVLAVIFGLLVYRFEMPLGRATLLGVAGIVGVIALGLRFPVYAGYDTWMWLLGLYILVASVTPVWILLQPRDYLSSFLLYAMMLAAVVGIVAAHPVIELPAFTSFEVNGQYLFPALFVTVACGAISGFHSLVASGTTSKQLSSERDARLVGFGSMLIESALGIASLIAVGYIFTRNGHAFTSQTPTQVLADGLSQMLACVGLGSESARGVTYGLIILAVSTFCLTSLDTATRLGRYMFQELWLAPGQSVKDVRGWRAVLVNKYVATLVTVGLGMSLGFGGYAKIWPLFGAANQLLAALALLAPEPFPPQRHVPAAHVLHAAGDALRPGAGHRGPGPCPAGRDGRYRGGPATGHRRAAAGAVAGAGARRLAGPAPQGAPGGEDGLDGSFSMKRPAEGRRP